VRTYLFDPSGKILRPTRLQPAQLRFICFGAKLTTRKALGVTRRGSKDARASTQTDSSLTGSPKTVNTINFVGLITDWTTVTDEFQITTSLRH